MESHNGLTRTIGARSTSAKASRSFEPHRRCQTCQIPLSRYNPGLTCYVHSSVGQLSSAKAYSRGRPQEVSRSKVWELYTTGSNGADIARFLGANPSTVYRILSEPQELGA